MGTHVDRTDAQLRRIVGGFFKVSSCRGQEVNKDVTDLMSAAGELSAQFQRE
jgi:hypothetical protein